MQYTTFVCFEFSSIIVHKDIYVNLGNHWGKSGLLSSFLHLPYIVISVIIPYRISDHCFALWPDLFAVALSLLFFRTVL